MGTITFNDGVDIDLENALPGASKEKTFSIAAQKDSTVSIKYNIKLNVTENNFEGNDLVYSIKGTTSGATSGTGNPVATVNEGALESSNRSVNIGNGLLAPGETHNYNFTIRFKETGSDQNSNQNKSFKGQLQVSTGDENGSSIYYNSSYSEGTTTQPTSESITDYPEE